jgi:hypothetical protein
VASYSFIASNCVLTVDTVPGINGIVVNSAVLQFVFGAVEIARKKVETNTKDG